MASYRLVTYAAAAGPRAGVVIGDEVFDAATLTGRAGDATVLGLLDDWAAARERLGKAAPAPGTGEKLAGVRLLAPVQWPSAIYCAGANYADHAAEMARLHSRPPEPDPHTLGLKPWHFIKAGRSTLAAPDDTVHDIRAVEDHGLGDRTGRRDRPPRQERRRRARPRPCRRLHHRQRPLGARHGPPAQCPGYLAVQVRLGGAQEFRRLLPARAVDRAGRRHSPTPRSSA